MGIHVLVTYGTKHGATKEIAEKIGQVLQESGLTVDVQNARHVADLAPYDAVVLGSALYIGAWCKEAATFLQANTEKLATLPVWIFSSGPTGAGDPKELVQGQLLPKKLEPIVEHIGPRDVTVFHGSSAGSQNFIEKWMIKQIGASLGDFRDWEAITSWAKSVAEALARN